jgi:N-acetylmuramoyl-L-alanine amidase-like
MLNNTFLNVIPHLMRNLFYSRDSRLRENDNLSCRHSESTLVGEESLPQKSKKILRRVYPANGGTQNDRLIGSFFSKRLLPLAIFFILTLTACTDAQNFTDKDAEICNTTFQLAVNENLSAKPIGDVIVEVGKSFLGTPYKAYTLETEGEEQLIINLTEFDCTTFLENVLALSRNIKQEKTSFEDFQKELTFIRYRNGKINKYPSRLHYFTDWIYNNEQKGIVKDVTEELGGKVFDKKLSFMSDHPTYYKHLKENPAFIEDIKMQEEVINRRTNFFIPQDEILNVEDKIMNGDLIAFTSSVKGLDVNHVGIAIRMEDKRIHILHAPVEGEPVQITKLPLSDYVKKIKKDTGIIVVRVLEPMS